MDIETLKQDLREGRISAERLVDLVADLCRKLEAANRRIEELEKQCAATPPAKVDEPFSTRAEEKRQEARGKKRRKRKPKGRRGRVSTADKVAQAERTEAVFPAGVPSDACWLSHVRPVWRLENGRAVLVAYQIYRGPGNRYGLAAVAQTPEPEDSREEVLLEEVGLVERQAVRGANQGDERAVRVEGSNGVDEKRCGGFKRLGHRVAC
jgi:hypothetical protein